MARCTTCQNEDTFAIVDRPGVGSIGVCRDHMKPGDLVEGESVRFAYHASVQPRPRAHYRSVIFYAIGAAEASAHVAALVEHGEYGPEARVVADATEHRGHGGAWIEEPSWLGMGVYLARESARESWRERRTS